MKTEVTSRELTKLLGLTLSTIADLRKRKIIEPIEWKKPVAAREDLANATAEPMQAGTVLASGLEKPDSRERFRPNFRKRVRSFRIYLREGWFYTVWDK